MRKPLGNNGLGCDFENRCLSLGRKQVHQRIGSLSRTMAGILLEENCKTLLKSYINEGIKEETCK